MSFLAFTSLICLFPSLVLAQHDHVDSVNEMDGMDSMDGMGGVQGGTMRMYLHFTPGDSVLFGPWIPNTDRAVFGTCVGMFMLAMVDRWFSAITAVMNAYWNKKVARAPPTELKAILSSLPPFVPRHDIPRGIASLGTRAVHFTLMLIVMTQNVSFIVSIIFGLGFGEMLFGRYATHGC